MKTGIDLKNLWLYGKGIGAFTTAVLNDIGTESVNRTDEPISLFAPTDDFKSAKKLSENNRFKVIQTGAFDKKSRFEKLKYDQWTLYRSLTEHNIDLLFSPYYDIPVLWTKAVITTVHDLSIIELPGIYSKGYFYYNKLLLERALSKSLFVVTVSEYSKEKISSVYGIEREKIKVVYNRAPDFFLNEPVMETERIMSIRKKYLLPDEFILYTGGLEARKNIQLLHSAVAKLYEEGKIPPLVITGGEKANEPNSAFSFLAGKKYIHLLKTVPDEEMPYIYKMADLIINTSTYEGFGLPLLEALSLQKTMLCSDIPVYREIGKDAVLYFRNNSIDDLTDKLQGYFTGKYNDIPVNEMKSRADFFNQKNYGIVFLEMFKGSQS